jgi:hypothetical protein
MLGQTFTITRGEIPTGAALEADSVTLELQRFKQPPPTMRVELRSTDATTVLATATLATPDIPKKAAPVTLEFDEPAALQQGEQYLLTTDFGGETATAADAVAIGHTTSQWGDRPLDDAANYGGLANTVVRSQDGWMTIAGSRTRFDLTFTLRGRVVAGSD